MMPLSLPDRDITETYDEHIEFIQLADRLGYDEIWIGEHYTCKWENVPAPDLLIAKAIPLTKRIRLGTGVSILPFHNPFELAHRIACLDHLAHGRLNFGVGSGGYVPDYAVFDAEDGKVRLAKTREALDIILKIWQGDPFEYQGQHFQFRSPAPNQSCGSAMYLRPYQKPHPPIGVAGASKNSATLSLAGANGWIPLSGTFGSPEVFRTHWQTVSEAAEKANRQASRRQWRISREIYVADSAEQAFDEAMQWGPGRSLDEFFIPMWRSQNILSQFKDDPNVPDDKVDGRYILEQSGIVGSPDDCVEKLRDLYQQVGGFGTVIMTTHDLTPHPEKWDRSVTLFAEKVLPRLADLVPAN